MLLQKDKRGIIMAGKTKVKGITSPPVGTAEVILSVYWYNDKPISVIGIKNGNTKVGHEISKFAIPEEAWFGVASTVKKISRMTEETRSSLINNILSDELKVKFPVAAAIDLFDYAGLTHTIVKKLIEV